KLAPLTARGASVGRSANRRPAGVTTERMRSQEFAGSAPGAAPRRRIPARRVHSHGNVLVTSHRGAYNRPSGKRSGSLAKEVVNLCVIPRTQNPRNRRGFRASGTVYL